MIVSLADLLYSSLYFDLPRHAFYFALLFFLYHCFFFFNDTATTEIYTLSLHDALPISFSGAPVSAQLSRWREEVERATFVWRSEEHTSELQSHSDLVCRLLLEKKKKKE